MGTSVGGSLRYASSTHASELPPDERGSWGDSAVSPSSICFELTAPSRDLLSSPAWPLWSSHSSRVDVHIFLLYGQVTVFGCSQADVQDSYTHLHIRGAGEVAWREALAQQTCSVGKPQ